MSAASGPAPTRTTSPRPQASVTRRWQVGLIGGGLLLTAVGGVVLLDLVEPRNYVGILSWFAGAIIIHDGIIAGIVFAVALAMRKVGRRIPPAVIAIIQGALVVGAVVTLIVVPQIFQRAMGTLNPTVLPLNYVFNLGVFAGVLAVLTALAVVAYLRLVARRQNVRPPSSQT